MFEMKRLVTASCCGDDELQTPTSMISMMQDCSHMWLTSEPRLQEWMKDNHLAMLITSRQMDIYRRPAYRESVSVRTSVFGFKGCLGYRNTYIYDEQGNTLAASWSTGPFLDNVALKLFKLPKNVTDFVTIDEKQEMEYLNRKIKVPQGELEPLPTIDVVRSDIDFYHHVNNANYVRMACDILPEGFSWDRMRVEYKSQAKLGMTIHPSLLMGEDGAYLRLADDEGAPFVNLEFTTRSV